MRRYSSSLGRRHGSGLLVAFHLQSGGRERWMQVLIKLSLVCLPSSPPWRLSHSLWTAATLFREGLHTAVQLLWKCILRHGQKCVFQEFLNLVKMPMQIGKGAHTRESNSLKEIVMTYYKIPWMGSVDNSERIIQLMWRKFKACVK